MTYSIQVWDQYMQPILTQFLQTFAYVVKLDMLPYWFQVLNCFPLQFVCIDILDSVLTFSKEEGGNVEVSFSKAGCLMWQKDEEKVSFSLWEG